jgi:uncharacterized membrane protein
MQLRKITYNLHVFCVVPRYYNPDQKSYRIIFLVASIYLAPLEKNIFKMRVNVYAEIDLKLLV